jgi:hypothetical protein
MVKGGQPEDQPVVFLEQLIALLHALAELLRVSFAKTDILAKVLDLLGFVSGQEKINFVFDGRGMA